MDLLLDIAKLKSIAAQAAWGRAYELDAHRYLPRSPFEAATWKPHSWVIDAMQDAIKEERKAKAHPEPVMSPAQLRECVSFMHFYALKYKCPPNNAASIYINMLEN